MITERFVAFCAEHSLDVLSNSTVRHWCWEWSAWQAGDVNRYLILLVWEDPRPDTRYRAEFWGEADNETLFARRRASRLRFSERDVTASSFVAALRKAFASAWQCAERLTGKDLSEPYAKEVVFPESRGAALQAIVNTIPRVLVVDDDASLREMVRHALEEGPDPIRVEEARDGLEALRKSELQKPDVLLLDMAMPGMTSLDVLKQLRADPVLASVPIMLVTASEAGTSDAQSVEIWGDDYLVKPFTLSELRARIDRLLRRSPRIPSGRSTRS